MKKLVTGIFFVFLWGSFFASSPQKPPQSNPTEPIEVLAQAVQPEIPSLLSIPAIKVNASVVPVGLTEEKIVDTPTQDIGWYEKGVRPGAIGNANFNGHFKMESGTPGVFYNLSKLKTGDDIYSTGRNGGKYHFKVTQVELIDTDKFPIKKIYGPGEKPQIILITCAGKYVPKTRDYTKRTIIYAELSRNPR